MSLLPYVVRNLLDEGDLPLTYLPQLSMRDLYQPGSLITAYTRPWRHLVGKESGTSSVNVDKEKFEVVLHMHQFEPSEITVKVVDNNIVIEGKHEEKEDEHGFIYRHFVRRYILPKDASPDDVTSTISSDGVLTVTAPRKSLPAGPERVISIQQSGEPHAKNTASIGN
ncbi:hypothetical protein J437_LFUL007549 [Ladona fulva]|uniref:SHSP domain-containing protein n=1 Tax=Ladona fulva TaxID=123851 RepID=A0A8K0JUE8_LADFU|nr:hypothetical protein J437_LFUL007549 [Ladona fulva]